MLYFLDEHLINPTETMWILLSQLAVSGCCTSLMVHLFEVKWDSTVNIVLSHRETYLSKMLSHTFLRLDILTIEKGNLSIESSSCRQSEVYLASEMVFNTAKYWQFT